MAGQDDAGHAGALGAPQYRTQIVGVGDAVEDQEEGHPAALGGLAEVLERRLLDGPGEGDDALGTVRPGRGASIRLQVAAAPLQHFEGTITLRSATRNQASPSMIWITSSRR